MNSPYTVGLGLYVLAELCLRGRIVITLYKEFARLIILFDLGCTQALQKVIKPAYVLQGGCHKRGVCCQHIIGDPPRFIKRSFLARWYAAFHLLMHRFDLVARGPNDELIFSCGHLQSDGRCGIYRYRPRLCRNYPVVPFFGVPKVLPGCGYVVVPRVVAKMQSRKSLPIVNPQVGVHHPTPAPRPPQAIESFDDYHLVEGP